LQIEITVRRAKQWFGGEQVGAYKPFNSQSPNPKKRKIPNFILQNIEKEIVYSKSAAEEASFEWSPYRVSFTDSKGKTIYWMFS